MTMLREREWIVSGLWLVGCDRQSTLLMHGWQHMWLYSIQLEQPARLNLKGNIIGFIYYDTIFSSTRNAWLVGRGD